MNTKTIFNLSSNQPVAAAITGNSPWPVYATNELIDFLGGTESAFHKIKQLQKRNLLPRIGGESKPLTMRDLEFARKNEQLGYRHWQWISEQSWLVRQCTGYDYVRGYGYYTQNGFIIVDENNETEFSVNKSGL